MSLSKVQVLAVQSVRAVAQGCNLSDELARLLVDNIDLSMQDRGMLQDIAYGVQRFAGSLRFMLKQMLNKPLQNKDLESFLLVAIYQLHYTRNAPHAVVNEVVQHIGKIDHGQFRGLANALLRRFQREQVHLAQKCHLDDVARYNLPLWLLNYFKDHYPKYWHNIAKAMMKHPPLTVRVNRRWGNALQYLTCLQEVGLDGKILGDYAVRLHEAVPVGKLPLFIQGGVSVQDWGAQQAAGLLNVQDGERVLDACAAPGGKTGHILENANCHLTALDIDAIRLQRVRENLTRLNLSAQLHCAPAQDLDAWYDGKPFDAILADVPCTASGTIKRNPDIKWLRRVGDAANMAHQQEKLLDTLWTILKSGGRMLLATCSLFEVENQVQCRHFLARHTDAILQEEKLLLPNDQQDGFYYALLQKR